MGLSIRTPLGTTYREYPGSPASYLDQTDIQSSWGGELLPRMLNAYLRGMF
jgi:hypothetical protein